MTQLHPDREQIQIQQRLASIEESRRLDEVEVRERARRAELVADVRVIEFRLERPGGSGSSDKVSITVENRGPATARSIDVAMIDSESRAESSHLGEVVEWLERGGRDSKWRDGYFRIPWELDGPRPLGALAPNAQVTFPFWLRYRQGGNVGLRVVWEDGTGPQVSRPAVRFDAEPAWRY